MGSSGSKPRKSEQHHLPKVGSPENEAYELRQRRKEVFRGWPIALVVAVLVIVFAAWIAIT